MLVFDRVIRTLTGGWSCHGAEVLFVTRLKDNVDYNVHDQRPVPQGPEILRDEVIVLAQRKKRGRAARVRRIELWMEEKGEPMVFVTKHLKLAVSTVVQDYRER